MSCAGLGAAQLLPRCLTVLVATLVAVGAYPSASIAAAGVQVTINGAPGAFISPDEITQNIDVEPQPGQYELVQEGLSAKLLAELVGVAPAYSLNTMTAGGTGTFIPQSAQLGGSNPTQLSRADVVSGFTADFTNPPFTTFAIFQSHPDASDVDFDTPEYVNNGFTQPLYYFVLESRPDAPFPVDLAVSGTVLSVPQPVFDVCTPGVGQTVDFGLPPGGVVGFGQGQGAPADTNGLTFSWDFGDGSPPTALSATSATSHAFAAVGTFDVRLTAVDAAGNAGVSPVAAQVAVGSAPGPPGACGQLPGNSSVTGGHGGRGSGSSPAHAGSQSTGGGNGAQGTLSSGAASGSVHALTSTVAPRTSGKAAPNAPASSSSSGSGGSGGAGGDHGGSGDSRGTGTATAQHGGSTASGGGGSQAQNSAARAFPSGGGAGGSKPPEHVPAAGAPAAAGLTGVLIDSLGSAASAVHPAPATTALSLLQSVARASSGGSSSHGGLPAWLLGVASLIALLVLGVVREAGPGLASRLRDRFGAGGSRTAGLA